MIIFWVCVLGLSILLYVLLDGFDLGVGIVSGFTRNGTWHREMMSAVAPVWDGNETWLIVAGVILWGAFPIVYATLFSALYLPTVLMLVGLILRGVAFEFYGKTERWRWIWIGAFSGGSLLAAFMQGMMVGALVAGLPIAQGQHSGGALGWLTPFTLLCGTGLCLGYVLAGASWLVRKCEGEVQAVAYGLIPGLSFAALAVLAVLFILALSEHMRVLNRWFERPYLFVFPAIGIAAGLVLAWSIRWRRERIPFEMVIITFAAAFGTFAITFWPYMIPFSITVKEAAAPHASLAFMFWGEGLFVLPLMLLYTTISYRVFRGKTRSSPDTY